MVLGRELEKVKGIIMRNGYQSSKTMGGNPVLLGRVYINEYAP
jgi:hypothetical protein